MRRLCLALALVIAVPAPADEVEPSAGFRIWLDNYRAAAVAHGVAPAWLDAALVDVRYSPRVVALDRAQPDAAASKTLFSDYLAAKFAGDRISHGRARAAELRSVITEIARRSGVAPEIILAIWGIESSYGRVTGDYDLVPALATLAFDGRRGALFTRELDAAVRIIGEGRMPRAALRGSWAGAFGQPQFLPTSYLAHGADGDSDGKVDLVGSTPDALASIARYLTDNGWQSGVAWGFRAGVPAGFDRASVANPVKPTSCVRPLERHSRWLPAAEWRARGFTAFNAAWPGDGEPMSLVEPDGEGRGAFLTTANYRVIMSYNCSNFYALSVALLGDAVASAAR